MRTEHYLFHVLGIAPKSRAKVSAQQWMMSFSPRLLATYRSKSVILVSLFLGVNWSRCFVFCC